MEQEQKPTTHYLLEKNIAEVLGKYLVKQPFDEVDTFVQALRNAIPMNVETAPKTAESKEPNVVD